MLDLAGAIHVHSTLSDGSSPVWEIVEAARFAGLDYLVLTDHDTESSPPGLGGWHEGLLVVPAAEVCPRGGGHFVALGADVPKGMRKRRVNECLEEIGAARGFSFVAHPQGKSLFGSHERASGLPAWPLWESGAFAGMEVWSYLHDWYEGFRPWKLLSYARSHADRITGPDGRVLRKWDELGKERRVSGLGALDNHAKRLPLLGRVVFPHEEIFRTLRTHVLVPPPTGEKDLDTSRVVGALASGCAYVSLDSLAPARGFRFWYEPPAGPRRKMGEEVAFPLRSSACHCGGRVQAGGVFRCSCPVEAEIGLLRDGNVVAKVAGRTLEHVPDRPGVYRVEALLAGKKWIVSNPVYLRKCAPHRRA